MQDQFSKPAAVGRGSCAIASLSENSGAQQLLLLNRVVVGLLFFVCVCECGVRLLGYRVNVLQFIVVLFHFDSCLGWSQQW